MTPPGDLKWESVPSPLMPAMRRLTDGVSPMMLLLNLRPPQALPDTKGQAPHWIMHFTTHTLGHTTGERQSYRFPVVSWADGTGDLAFQLVLTDPRAWNDRLRGTTLPPYVDQERRIHFPPVPPLLHPLDGDWGQYDDP
jgi:hypothetical protein